MNRSLLRDGLVIPRGVRSEMSVTRLPAVVSIGGRASCEVLVTCSTVRSVGLKGRPDLVVPTLGVGSLGFCVSVR